MKYVSEEDYDENIRAEQKRIAGQNAAAAHMQQMRYWTIIFFLYNMELQGYYPEETLIEWIQNEDITKAQSTFTIRWKEGEKSWNFVREDILNYRMMLQNDSRNIFSILKTMRMYSCSAVTSCHSF